MLRRLAGCFLVGSLAVSGFVTATDTPDYLAGSLARQEAQPIYSSNPRDPWNHIFYLLFTRTIETRLTQDFRVEGPFAPTRVMGNAALPVTTQTFERIEGGDRAIDPLYPNLSSTKGSEPILNDSGFGELKQALQEACAETSPRPAVQRALMQSDVWAAYEIVSWSRADDGAMGEHARALLPLFEQFIAKLALSSEEIAALPHNYVAAQSSLNLPRTFDASSGWMEIEWFPRRSHDEEGGNRHAARIFLNPVAKPKTFIDDVNGRIRKHKDPLPDGFQSLQGAALITEVLLIDRTGRVVPSPLISDLQLRTAARDAQGKFTGTTVDEFELSRWELLTNPSSGGFIHRSADEPAYMAASGNDFTFASFMISEKEPKPAVLGTLRRRCDSCHGSDPEVFTFGIIEIPGRPPFKLRQLNPADDSHALEVAKRKMASKDFQSLHVGP